MERTQIVEESGITTCKILIWFRASPDYNKQQNGFDSLSRLTTRWTRNRYTMLLFGYGNIE